MWILKGLISLVMDFIETLVVSLALFVLIYLFLFQPNQVVGHSMEPTFHDNDYILTDKLSYRFHEPQRGDVIVFKAPVNEKEDYIKRIIGLPGDTVMVKEGKVYVNGSLLRESYLQDPETPADVFLSEGKVVSVPEGKYIVMGDNRKHSSDSRRWGFVSSEEIVGRVFFRYWPLSQFGIVKTQEKDVTMQAVKGVMRKR